MRRARRAGVAVIALVALTEQLVAARRALSADEALYVCAARSMPWGWPLPDHPPLIGALLAAAMHVLPGPIELRARSVSIVLATLLAVAIATLSERWSPRRGDGRAFVFGAVLASVGLLPFAGALIVTPDAPMLAALGGMAVAVDVAGDEMASVRGRRVAVFAAGLLAALAVVSKVSALAVALPIAFTLAFDRRPGARRSTAAVLAIGAVAPLGFDVVRRSLYLQVAHAIGGGPLVSAPHVGPSLALLALAGAQVGLWGPAIVWTATRRAGRSTVPDWMLGACGTLGALVVASALLSGRPPEPGWLAPLGLAIFPAAAGTMASTDDRIAALIVASATLPALVALTVWTLAISVEGPLARVPPALPTHDGKPTDADLARWSAALRTLDPTPPRYVPAAWTCAYLSGKSAFDFNLLQAKSSTPTQE